MPGPLFTLTSDFGAGSGYPAQMKGVLLAAHPDARIVDVSHDVPHFDVLAGALIAESCLPWFPPDALHLLVVDPGVGTARRALCLVDAQDRRLLAPDNVLLTPFLAGGVRAFVIQPGTAVPAPRSATFHGRDLFAPAAVYLASGGAPEELGPQIDDPVRLPWPRAEVRGREVRGETLGADAFGNLVTSIRAGDLTGPVSAAWVAERSVRFVRTFAEGAPGELIAYVGSSDRLEVAMREASAAARLGTRGLSVRLVLA